MGRCSVLVISLLIAVISAVLVPATASAHRDQCHLWHSCESDTASYVCGDLGVFTDCTTVLAPPTATVSVGSIAGGPVAGVNQSPANAATVNGKQAFTVHWTIMNTDESQRLYITKVRPSSSGAVSSGDIVMSIPLQGNQESHTIPGVLPAGTYWWVVETYHEGSGATHYSTATSFRVLPKVVMPRIGLTRQWMRYGFIRIVVKSDSNVAWTRVRSRMNGRQPPWGASFSAEDTKYTDAFFFSKPRHIKPGSKQRITVWLRGGSYMTKRTLLFTW